MPCVFICVFFFVCFAGDSALCGHERAARSLPQLHPSSCAGAGAGVSLHLWQVKKEINLPGICQQTCLVLYRETHRA